MAMCCCVRTGVVAQPGSAPNTTPNWQLVVVGLPSRLPGATQTTPGNAQAGLGHCTKQGWVARCHGNGLVAEPGWPQPPFQTRPRRLALSSLAALPWWPAMVGCQMEGSPVSWWHRLWGGIWVEVKALGPLMGR